MMDYTKYRYSREEFVRYLLIGLGLSSGIAYLFYKSLFAVFLFSPSVILYLKSKKKELIEQRKWQVNLEFREGLISLSGTLNAGYSIENAFREAVKDLKLIYEEESYIIKEFDYITAQISMNKTVEETLNDFAVRCQVEDITNFAEVFITAKRTGGDIIKIMKTTCRNIGDKIEIKRQIITMITAKKFEARIMNLIPFGIILYMWICSPGFLRPLYHNFFGVMVMTAALLLYLLAYKMSERIMDIKV